MLIFIKNVPRAYAWGSRDALPELLGTSPTGEPQAELWLGDHPGAPASVAKGGASLLTLIDLIESDPELYGVDGKHLPFLMKVLGIGAPLSLQVHPNKQQAIEGFVREEAAGIPVTARERNYGDANHKPELLVALGEVSALCGFRPLDEARADFAALAAAAAAGPGREALMRAADHCAVSNEESAGEARSSLLTWLFSDANAAKDSAQAIAATLELETPAIEEDRRRSLRELATTYPGDVGVVLSLLLHLVTLKPGQAVYLGAQQLHAYLGGIAVEVMAASDNVLRAGLTEKHVDADEVLRIVDMSTLDTPRLEPAELAPGLIAWQPQVSDFMLMRARVGDADDDAAHDEPTAIEHETGPARAEAVQLDTPYPMVLIVVSGRVRVERVGSELAEVASVGKGQSLYVSAGDPIELSGHADVFLATVGVDWPRVS